MHASLVWIAIAIASAITLLHLLPRRQVEALVGFGSFTSSLGGGVCVRGAQG